MSVTILGSADIVEGGLYTPESGADRIVVVSGFGESSYDSRPLAGVSIGGVAMTAAIAESTSGGLVKGGIFYIKESQIPVGALEFLADWDGNIHEALEGRIYTLSGVDQITPVGSVVSDGNNTSNSLSITLASANDSVLIGAIGTSSPSTKISDTNTASNSNFTYTLDRNSILSAHCAASLSKEVLTGSSCNLQPRVFGTTTNKVAAAMAVFLPAASASDNIDTDNNIDQHQRDVALNHSLASPLTSVLINNVEHIDLIQNSDAELKYIKRCYDAIGSDVTSVILKNGVDADVTIPSVTVNTTHPYPVPNEAVDSNSMFSGVTVSGDNAAFRITSAPTKGTLDLSDPAKYLHDVDASKGGVYTPNPGATGTDSFTFEVHDPDEPVALNRTQSGTVTINIVDGEVVPEPIVELVATIIITGPSELIHKRGTTYTDQGATALDGEGADITSSIITTNNVNDTVVGDYYVYYTVSGVTVRRKVNVVEITENSLRLVNRNRVIGF